MDKNLTKNSNFSLMAPLMCALLVLFVTPSFITSEIKVKRFDHVSEYEFGSLLHIEKSPELFFFTVNGARPKGSAQLDGWFFSIGFEPHLRFEGLLSTQPGEPIKWFSQQHKVKIPTLKQATDLRLPASTTTRLKKVERVRRRHESQVIWQILSKTDGSIEHLCHESPTQQVITSVFGKPRRLPSGRHYFHSGVDLKAATGNPIFSSAPGTVVLATHRGVSGNTVVLDHGGGLFTQYFHLSKIEVSIGEKVGPSQQIGLAGATGRVTGPHLHWEVVFNKKKIDPIRFLNLSEKFCQKISSATRSSSTKM